MNALEINSLTYRYRSRGAYNRAEPVLENVSLQLPESAFMVIIGPNGGGKSTLIKLILGLLPIQEGNINIFGKPLSSKQSTERLVGYVPQDSEQIKQFPVNVLDTVLMGLGKANKHNTERAMTCLDRLGMADYRARRMNELSTGQRQRVLLARALAPASKLLVLDEPTSGIDPAGQQIILDVLKSLKDTTIIFISHDLSVIPGYATSVACVNKELHYHPSGEITATLMGQAYGNVPSLSLVCHDCQHTHAEATHD
jgi:zinc transport system ATP-binding protein